MPSFQPIGKPKWCEKINLSFDLNVEHFAIRRTPAQIQDTGNMAGLFTGSSYSLFPLIRSWVNSCCHIFFHAVLSFVFIYLECLCQDCRFKKPFFNGWNRLQFWRKYNNRETVYFDLFPFYSKVRRQTGGALGIVWMIYYWLTSWLASHWELLTFPDHGTHQQKEKYLSLFGTDCKSVSISQCLALPAFADFRLLVFYHLKDRNKKDLIHSVWSNTTLYLCCSSIIYAQLYMHTHIYILNTLPLNNREKQMVDNNNGSSSPTKACNYYNYTILD